MNFEASFNARTTFGNSSFSSCSIVCNFSSTFKSSFSLILKTKFDQSIRELKGNVIESQIIVGTH